MCRSGAVWEMCVTIFQGVDINVGREMIRETAKAWELLTLHAPVSILNVNRHVSRKGLNKYRFFGRSAGESLYSLSKKKFRFAKLHMNKPQNISGTMHFGQMRTEWRCLPIMHKTKLSISPQTPQTNCLHCGWDVMILHPQKTLQSLSHPGSLYTKEVKRYFELNVTQQIYNKKAEKEKNKCVEIVQWKTRPQPNWYSVVGV